MRRLVALAILAACHVGAAAHQERRLTLAADGSIPELPSAYATTRLRIAFAHPGASPIASMAFEAGGHNTPVPACLLARLPALSAKDIALSGSWYHDLATMPPYVLVRIQPAAVGARPSPRDAYELTFSLVDATLLSIDRRIDSARSTVDRQALDDHCRPLVHR